MPTFDVSKWQPNVARATVVKDRLQAEIRKIQESLPEVNEADIFVACQGLQTAMFLEVDALAHAMDKKIGELQKEKTPAEPVSSDPRVGVA